MSLTVDGVSQAYQTYAAAKTDSAQKEETYSYKADLSDPVDTVEFSTKPAKDDESAQESSDVPISKRIGSGIASAICPGFGQLVNGEPAKAAKYFLGTYGLPVAGTIAAGAAAAAGISAAPAILVVGAIAGTICYAANIVDAAKGAN